MLVYLETNGCMTILMIGLGLELAVSAGHWSQFRESPLQKPRM